MDSVATPWIVGCAAGAGVATGCAYFLLLRYTIRRYLTERSAMLPVALTLLRVAGAGAVLAALARLGALPLLVGLAGFVAARTVAVQVVRREA